MKGPRFVVRSVTGYPASEYRPRGGPRTDYYVMDSLVCYRVVASFPSRGHAKRSDKRREKAERLAATLNRGDEAWRDALERDSEHAA